MHWRRFTISLIITLFLIFVLNRHWGTLPPLGKLLSPQQGFWQNAEPVNRDFSGSVNLPALQQPAKVWMDSRLVPHVFAANDHDLYYLQGYITAQLRLWQMEMQVRAAGGRVAEVIGEKAIDFDRMQRRKGMVSAAMLSLQAMEADTATKTMLDAYTAGINAYIATLGFRDLPLEYKLLNYHPEAWTNLKSALLLKYMADDLSGYSDDLENTNFLSLGLTDPAFSMQHFDQLFPDYPDSNYSIIPTNTPFYRPSVHQPVPLADSLWMKALQQVKVTMPYKPDPDNGSNNWAISGKRTKSGAPILANDPHLGLRLPSLWFEIQLHAPGTNVYGASLPGAPGVIIGFNDHIAWGVTNAQRDVKDYYNIRFKDASKQQYWFNGRWKNALLKVEEIKVRGHADLQDTVAYTAFGPVIFEPTFPDTLSRHPYLAMHWAAADSSNELKTFYLLNRARNYDDYMGALKYFNCPAQNFAYADKSGNIAIWQQGKFPLRPKEMGKFILPGDDSTFAWKGYIPFQENPHALDPDQGFLFSANQNPTDTTYPYRYFGDFIHYRAKHIHNTLQSMNSITIQDMMNLQTDYHDDFARLSLSLMLHYLDTSALSAPYDKYEDTLRHWDYDMQPWSTAPTLFQAWWDSLYTNIWSDDFQNAQHLPMPKPTDNTTIEWLLRDPNMPYVDNRNTPRKETLRILVQDAFTKAMDAVGKADTGHTLAWGNYRGTDIMHLTNIDAFSHKHLFTGGDRYTVNAIKKDHGPSWRMIVQLSDSTIAYGIYPGGQSGNPGSRYYDAFIDDWSKGKYYQLHVFSPSDSSSRYVKYRLTFK